MSYMYIYFQYLHVSDSSIISTLCVFVLQVLGFSFTGQATKDERMAMIILAHPKGLQIGEYIETNWHISLIKSSLMH
jgi:hypothetical protein